MKITKTQLKQIIKEEISKALSEDFTHHQLTPCEEQAARDSYGRASTDKPDVEDWSHWTDEQRAHFPRGYTWSRADRNKCRAEMRKPEDQRYFSPSDIFQDVWVEREKAIRDRGYLEEELNEAVYSDKQRRYMCAMAEDDADRPEGLSQKEAKELCKGPMKKKD